MSGDGLALVLTLAALALAVLGVRVLVREWVRRGDVAQRSALLEVEKRAGRPAGRINTKLRRTGFGSDIELQLASAGTAARPVDFLLAVAGLFLFVTLLASAIFPPWLAAVAGFFAARIPWTWLEWKRRRRREQFIAQLPEVARILSNASSAGLAMRTAIGMAADELEDPASTELEFVAEELEVGQTVEGALANLEARMPSRDVGVLISTLVIQQRAGGDLVRALREMAEALDKRRDLRREMRTVMAGTVFTGYLVALMGIGGLVILEGIRPGVVSRMAEETAGQLVLLGATGLYALGFFLIKRITVIEV